MKKFLFVAVSAAVGAFIATKPQKGKLVLDLEEMRKDKSEGSLYFAWQSNIALNFYDECISKGSTMEAEALKKLCNDGAKRFLNQLIYTLSSNE